MLRTRLVRFLAALVASSAPLLASLTFGTLQANAAYPNPLPPVVASFYVRTTSTATLDGLGCNQGTADSSAVNSEVILDFGAQRADGGGTYLTGSNTPVSNAQIVDLANNFADGYYRCSSSLPRLRLDVGTTNNGAVSYNYGSIWATQVVTQVANHVINLQHSWQETVWAANDFEPLWSSYASALDWYNGFAANSPAAVVNYGTADNCPQTIHSPSGLCANNWTQDNVAQLAYVLPKARMVPEIYTDVNTQQWSQIAWEVSAFHSMTLYFEGPMGTAVDPGLWDAPTSWQSLDWGINGGYCPAANCGQQMPYVHSLHIAN